MHVHFRNVYSHLQKVALLKYLSVLNPLKKKEFKVLPKPDGILVRLMPSSAIEAANSAISEFLPMALSMKTVPLFAIR